MWSSFFRLSTITNGNNYSIIEGEWKIGELVQIIIVNMYNSGSLAEKRAVWEEV